VTGYRISQAASLTGLSMSALRFYEDEGVLPPAPRSSGGYRQYAEADLDRLRFLARARNLGLALDEVRDLLAVWDGGTCATARTRLSGLVDAKIADLDRRMSDLERLKTELQHVQAALTAATATGSCGPNCACMAATACTLGGSDLAERLASWAAILTQARDRTAVPGGVQVALPAEPALMARIAGLVALEKQCCSFLTFSLTVRAPGELILTATGPAGTQGLLEDLLGDPA
jgi:DNA-binding transcriptional MerR regulator